MLSVLVMSYPFLADRANLGAGQLLWAEQTRAQDSIHLKVLQDRRRGLTPRPIFVSITAHRTALFRPNFQKSNTYFVGFRFRYTGNLHGVLPTLMPALNRFGNAVPDIFNRGTVRAHHSRNGLRHRRFRCGSYLFIIGDGLSC